MDMRERIERLRRVSLNNRRYDMSRQEAYLELLSLYRVKRWSGVSKRAARYEAVETVAGMTGRTPSQFGKWLNPGRPRPIPPRSESDQLTFF